MTTSTFLPQDLQIWALPFNAARAETSVLDLAFSAMALPPFKYRSRHLRRELSLTPSDRRESLLQLVSRKKILISGQNAQAKEISRNLIDYQIGWLYVKAAAIIAAHIAKTTNPQRTMEVTNRQIPPI
jgi:hypothetical protein